jgi:hypothetical protein
MRDMWKRPYRDPWRMLTGGLAALGTAFFGFIVVRMFTTSEPVSITTIVLIFIFGLAWLTAAWRLHRIALVISSRGVRVRWLFRTRTLTWDHIEGFRAGQDAAAVRLLVDLTDGSEVRTPVQRARSERMRVNDGSTWLLPEAFDHLLADLRGRLAEPHLRRSDPDPP